MTRAEKVLDAKLILQELELPAIVINDRSALVLLALLRVHPESSWQEATRNEIGVLGLMKFIGDEYNKLYAPNTRETIRKDTLHHFVEAGLVTKNPGSPDRPTNSPNTVYQLETVAYEVLRTYRTASWSENLAAYKSSRRSLQSQYAQERTSNRIPVRVSGKQSIQLSPGGQSLLVKKILDDFCVFFLPAAEVVYIGDTAERFAVLERQLLEELGVRLPEHGKLPDVVVFDRDRNWLVLIEAVESGGEIDAKRRRELQRLFLGCRAGLVFVSAFHTRQTFKRHLSAIAWETEVWIAENPTHLIHFDGNKFLGPFAEPV